MAGTVTDPPPYRPPQIPVGGGGSSPGKRGKRVSQPSGGGAGAPARWLVVVGGRVGRWWPLPPPRLSRGYTTLRFWRPR